MFYYDSCYENMFLLILIKISIFNIYNKKYINHYIKLCLLQVSKSRRHLLYRSVEKTTDWKKWRINCFCRPLLGKMCRIVA